ncbi:MAG: polysaccharide biosynthesis protein, partial [Casimicrobiaceae bacterium]
MSRAASDSQIGPPLPALDALIVGRAASLFASDMDAERPKIDAMFRGARVLVVGGGGSIGAITVRLLLDYRPAAIHVVDLSENYLAELVRDLRSSAQRIPVADFRTLP